MGNYDFRIRAKRWCKYLASYLHEKVHGLDFSMVYVGDLQRNTDEYHGYSMTDASDLMKMLRAVPVNRGTLSFLDVGCGKGMCLKCAAELGFKKVAGLDLDTHLLKIARKNMAKLKIKAECIYANAETFSSYADYDVFYFYNPFGRSVFTQVIQAIVDSQNIRNRDIWVIYYHPVFGDLFCQAGFTLENEVKDSTRDTTARIYHYSKTVRTDKKTGGFER